MSQLLARVLFAAACLLFQAQSASAGDSALSVSIAVAPENTRLAYMDSTSHFHVLVQNKSAQPQKVWEGWNSWGYYARSFELSQDEGKHWIVAKLKETVFTRNFPSFQTINPSDVLVLDVFFGDDRIWDGFPLRRGHENKVLLRAVFEISESAESKEYGVWTGRVDSDAIEVTFVR
jgi:hypothetical protein